MTEAKSPVLLTVLSGSFASQPLAFAALSDLADRAGSQVDLKDVDVIREAANVRLAHYFRPQIVARIQSLQARDNTVLVLRPCLLTADPRFPRDGDTPLRLLGRFAGSVIDLPDTDLS